MVDYQSEKSLNQAEIDDINPTDILINIGRNGLTSQVIKMIQIIPSWQRIIYIGCHFEKNLKDLKLLIPINQTIYQYQISDRINVFIIDKSIK